MRNCTTTPKVLPNIYFYHYLIHVKIQTNSAYITNIGSKPQVSLEGVIRTPDTACETLVLHAVSVLVLNTSLNIYEDRMPLNWLA